MLRVKNKSVVQQYANLFAFVFLVIGLTLTFVFWYKSHNLQPNLNHEIKQERKLTQSRQTEQSKVETINVAQTKQEENRDKVFRKFFKDMYQYKNGTEYVKNRAEALKLVDQKQVPNFNKMYATGLDDNGQNILNATKQKGYLKAAKFYTESPQQEKNKIVVHALITFAATNHYSDDTAHQGDVWFKFTYDEQANKIVKFDKEGIMEQTTQLNQE